jgi:hypothetical protein
LDKDVTLNVGPAERYQFEIGESGNVDQNYFSIVGQPVEVLTENAWTFFRDSLPIGTRMEETAPLAWGDAYFGIASSNFADELDRLSGLKLHVAEYWEDGWWVHRFELDDTNDTLSGAERRVVESALQRRIVDRRSRAYLTHPAPHHILSDGTWYIAAPCEKLQFRLTFPSDVQAHATNGTTLKIHREADGDTLTIGHPPSGPIELRVDGQPSLKVEIGNSSPFFAPGVRIVVGQQSIDLIELSASFDLRSALYSLESFELDLPYPELADRLQIAGGSLVNEGNTFQVRKPSPGELFIDGGPFGWCDTRRAQAAPSIEAAKNTFDDLRPLVGWLQSVAQRDGLGGTERLSGIDWLHCPEWLTRLQSRTWPSTFAPQVRHLQKCLAKKGVA